VHGGPAVTITPEHDGFSLLRGLVTGARADHGGDVVAEDGGITEVLHEGLRGDAGLDAKVILAFPLPPQPLVFAPGRQPGGGVIEDEGRLGSEAVE
jgi:hypothetical protein